MSRLPTLLGLAVLIGTAVPTSAWAQGRQLTGTVVRSTGDRPIPEALVSVQGTLLSTRTDVSGEFQLNVPAGAIRLLVRAIGFTRQEVAVPAGQTTVTVRMEEDVFKLDEVIITGQATQVERRSATTSVAYVTGEEVAKVASPTFESALNGRVTGVNIQSNSGAPGGGIQLQIRGNTTILGASDPLFVVDGVIYSNARINGGRSAAVAGASVSEDDPINRVADINPADIASIEILKGAAASSIYGSKASNGVVIIKTIRGIPGETRVNLSQRFGTFDLQRKLQSRTFTNSADAVAVFGAGVAQYFTGGTPPVFDHYDEVWGRNALSYETVGDVSGGTENTKYFLSGTWKQDEGIERNTGFSRQGVRLNVDQKLSSKFDVSVSSVFNRSFAERGWDNNGNVFATAGYALAYWPSFVSLLPNADGTFNPPAGPTNANPVQTSLLGRNQTEANRFTGGATLTWRAFTTATSSLRFIAAGGADIFNQQDEVYTPNELFFESIQALPGTALSQDAVSRQTNWNANAVHIFRPGSGTFQTTTSVGVQFEDRRLHTDRVTTTNLVPGQSNVDQGTNQVVAEALTQERTLALYGQEELLLLDDRLLVAGGVRAERSSVNGNIDKYYVFPKVSGSYRFVNVAPGMLGERAEVKLRAAYGETGNQPLFGQKFTNLNTPQFGGANGFTVAGTAGAPGIEPERLKEVEVGFDANLFGNRAQVEFTYYSRNTTNLLLNRTPAPSSGFTSEVFNGGKVRNRGVEIGLGLTPMQSRDFQWVARGTFTLNRNKVVELPVSPFRPPLSGFGGLGVTFIEEGQPMTQIIGFAFDDAGNRTATQVRLGNAAPDFRVGLTNDITMKSFNFSMVWDWQQGGSVINLTQFLYDDAGNAADFGSPAHTERLKAYNAGVMTPYIEDATFLKLREVSVGLNLPQSFVQAFGAGVRDVRLSLTGRNLLLFTKYTGLDPEVANFGSTAIRNNLDITPYPPSRSVFFNIALGF